MNVTQFLSSLLRRPLVLALVAILGIVAGAAGWLSVSQSHSYHSTAVAVIIPPGSGSVVATMNPLVNLNYNMAQLAAVVGTGLKTDAGTRAAKDAGGTGNFTVNTLIGDEAQGMEPSAQLSIVAEGTDAESARRAAAALVEFADSQLTEVQRYSGVPPRNNALLIPFVRPQAGSPVPTSPVRSAVAYALGAILSYLVLLLIFDALLQRTRSRAQDRLAKRTPPVAQDPRAVSEGDARVAEEADWLAAIAAPSSSSDERVRQA